MTSFMREEKSPLAMLMREAAVLVYVAGTLLAVSSIGGDLGLGWAGGILLLRMLASKAKSPVPLRPPKTGVFLEMSFLLEMKLLMIARVGLDVILKRLALTYSFISFCCSTSRINLLGERQWK